MIQAVTARLPAAKKHSLNTEVVACGVCGVPTHQRLYQEAYQLEDARVRLGINRCLGCGQIYVSPRLDRPSTTTMYARDTQQTISHSYCWSGQTSDERFGPLLDRLAQLRPSGRLLDVGCGTGSFLAAAAARQQWELLGLEPNTTDGAPTASGPPASIIRSTLEEAELPAGSCDIVTLLGVLEHLHDPVGTLRQVHRLLRPDGVLAVYVPNFHYLRWKDAGPTCWLRTRRWSRLAPQEHLFHFTPQLLRQLLDRGGFTLSQLDLGRPFLSDNPVRRWLKRRAFTLLRTLYTTTGLHLGGIEVIAIRRPSSQS